VCRVLTHTDIHYQQTARGAALTDGDRPNSGISIPDDLVQLSRAFPSPWSISFELDLNMRQRIRDLLPPKDEAQALCEQVRQNAFWQ
jgi:hypothetical protein